MLKKYLKKAGIESATIQTLRHTFGAQHEAKGTSQKPSRSHGVKDARSTFVYQN
jgi:integrase